MNKCQCLGHFFFYIVWCFTLDYLLLNYPFSLVCVSRYILSASYAQGTGSGPFELSLLPAVLELWSYWQGKWSYACEPTGVPGNFAIRCTLPVKFLDGHLPCCIGEWTRLGWTGFSYSAHGIKKCFFKKSKSLELEWTLKKSLSPIPWLRPREVNYPV